MYLDRKEQHPGCQSHSVMQHVSRELSSRANSGVSVSTAATAPDQGVVMDELKVAP